MDFASLRSILLTVLGRPPSDLWTPGRAWTAKMILENSHSKLAKSFTDFAACHCTFGALFDLLIPMKWAAVLIAQSGG